MVSFSVQETSANGKAG